MRSKQCSNKIEDIVLEATLITKGGSGPSGMDVEESLLRYNMEQLLPT